MSATVAIDLKSLCYEMDIGWSVRDVDELQAQLEPYTNAVLRHLNAGCEIPSHLAGTHAICAPVTSITDPYQLYNDTDGDVSDESFEVQEFDDYWITLHYSNVNVPIVILLLKQNCTPLAKLDELCDLCGRQLGFEAGGDTGAYIQWNGPNFGWAIHTDDDYEGVDSRIHVPLITSPQSFLCFAETLDAKEDEYILKVHPERGKIYRMNTTVPHTALNKNPVDGRLHLIVDVARVPYKG